MPSAVHGRSCRFQALTGCPTGRAFVNRGGLIATVVVPAVAGPALEAVVKAITTKSQQPDLRLIPSYSYTAIESLRPNRGGRAPIGTLDSRP